METCFKIRESTKKLKGREYYVNIETGVSTWGVPVTDEIKVEEGWEAVFSNKVFPGNIYYSNVSSGIRQWEDPKIEDVEEDLPLQNGWEKKLSSKCNNVYYVNEKLNKSQWENPIPKLTLKPAPIPKLTLKPAPAPISAPIPAPIPAPLIHKPNQAPRGLIWFSNSCYLDSALFAFFAGPKKFIDNMLDTNLYGVREVGECTIENLKKIQDELRKIYNSITRQGDPVIHCTNLRKSLENCPHREGFHTGVQADSGEFISYLTGLFPTDKNVMTTQSYYTNFLEPRFEQLKDREDTFKSETSDIVELIQTIDRDQIIEIGKYNNVMLSKFLVESLDGVLENFRADNGEQYIRRVQIRNITFSPYLIFNLYRVKEHGGRKIHTNIINPDEAIVIGDQIFFLSGAVMYNGNKHYVAIAKYNDFWWYYDDSRYTNSTSLLRFNDFDDFLSKVSELNLIDPRTHGTQFYYTPFSND